MPISNVARSGWGRNLDRFWHDVLCCLTPHTEDGLWVNHFTWTNDGPDDAHAVATWDIAGDDQRAWEIRVTLKVIMNRGAVVTVDVCPNAALNCSPQPALRYEIDHWGRRLIVNRILDVILKDKEDTWQ